MAIKIRLAIICVTAFFVSVFPVAPALAATKSCPQFEPLFKMYGLVPVKEFSYIAWRESRCRIKAINATWDANGKMTWHLNKDKSYDSGLLQINSTWKTVTKRVCNGGIDRLLVLDCNLRVAKYLFDNGGLNHWKSSAPKTKVKPVDGYKRN
jgi:hypothetical protein